MSANFAKMRFKARLGGVLQEGGGRNGTGRVFCKTLIYNWEEIIFKENDGESLSIQKKVVLLHPLFQREVHKNCRIRLVVQDNCLSRSRSPVRLRHAVQQSWKDRET